MNEFNPGDGWREVSEDEFHRCGAFDYAIRRWSNTGRLPTDGVSYWVREAPLPPLPTEPGAVIQWQDGAYLPQIAQLDPGDRHLGWWAPDDHGDPRWMTAEQLQRRIGSDKWTLLEPRDVTAKAVIDRVRALTAPAEMRVGMIPVLVQVAGEFGVES